MLCKDFDRHPNHPTGNVKLVIIFVKIYLAPREHFRILNSDNVNLLFTVAFRKSHISR